MPSNKATLVNVTEPASGDPPPPRKHRGVFGIAGTRPIRVPAHKGRSASRFAGSVSCIGR